MAAAEGTRCAAPLPCRRWAQLREELLPRPGGRQRLLEGRPALPSLPHAGNLKASKAGTAGALRMQVGGLY